MKKTIGCLSVALWMGLGLFGNAGTALAATDQEFAGEVVRITPDKKQMLLNVNEGVHEGQQVTIRIDNSVQLQGVEDVADLKEGSQVRVQTKKHWFLPQWIAQRLTYDPPAKPILAPVEKSKLQDIEGAFAHGEMGDIEYETKRQVLENSGKNASF